MKESVRRTIREIGRGMLKELEYEIQQLPGTQFSDELEYFDQALLIIQDLIDRQRKLIAEKTYRRSY